VKIRVKDNHMRIRTFGFPIPIVGFAFICPAALFYEEILGGSVFLVVFLTLPALFGLFLIGLPSCRAEIDFSKDQIIVSNMIFHVVPIRRFIRISDVKTIYVLRRPFFAGAGNTGPNFIDVEALQLIEKTGRETNVGHFHGYNRPYHYVTKNGGVAASYFN